MAKIDGRASRASRTVAWLTADGNALLLAAGKAVVILFTAGLSVGIVVIVMKSAL